MVYGGADAAGEIRKTSHLMEAAKELGVKLGSSE